MKQILIVKQKNLNSKEEFILCESNIEVENTNNQLRFTYKENKPFKGQVEVIATNEKCEIHRKAEAQSFLTFELDMETSGYIESEFGTFEVVIVTHKYLFSEKFIALEYEILNGSDSVESYRLLFKFKKVV